MDMNTVIFIFKIWSTQLVALLIAFKISPVSSQGNSDVIYSCSFETNNSACFTQDSDDSFDWTLHSEKTKSNFTGPNQAYKGSKYIYIETSSPRVRGDIASIQLRLPSLDVDGCLKLRYNMYGSTIGTLAILQKRKTSPTWDSLFTISGNQGQLWHGISLTIKDLLHKQIKIQGVVGSDYKSDIAIDDISITRGQCVCPEWKYGISCAKTCQCHRSSSSTCDPEFGTCTCKPGWTGTNCDCSDDTVCDKEFTTCSKNQCQCKDGTFSRPVNCSGLTGVVFYCSFLVGNNTCNIVQESGDKFDWTVRSEGTPSSPTGPSSAYHDLHYMFIESSNPRKKGDTASMQLQLPSIDGSGCLTLWYNMYGAGMGTLKVFEKKKTESDWNSLFIKSGNQGKEWKVAIISLSEINQSKIRIQGIVGANYTSDISIDEITITKGRCHGPTEAKIMPSKLLTTNIQEGQTLGPYSCITDCNTHCSIEWSFTSLQGTYQKLANTYYYSIHSATRRQSGRYRCKVTYKGSFVTVEHSIEVQFPPEIPIINADKFRNVSKIQKMENSTLELECTSKSNPVASIVWFHKGIHLGDETRIRSTKSILRLTELQWQYSGIYTCQAQNDIGDPVNSTFELKVQCAPRLENHESLQYIYKIELGRALNFTFRVIANPKPSVQWRGSNGIQPNIYTTFEKLGESDLMYLMTSYIRINDEKYLRSYTFSIGNVIGKRMYTIEVKEKDYNSSPWVAVGVHVTVSILFITAVLCIIYFIKKKDFLKQKPETNVVEESQIHYQNVTNPVFQQHHDNVDTEDPAMYTPLSECGAAKCYNNDAEEDMYEALN